VSPRRASQKAGARRRRVPPVRSIPWEELLETLRKLYHEGEAAGDWRSPYLRDHAESPFQVLIGTILSQRTRDETTDVASARLFAAYPTPETLAAAPVSTITKLIRPVGFYPTKAKGIQACARDLVERFGGKVPASMEELLSLPMVGRKTANCTLVFGFGLPAVPVDTHVHRIANRLGAVRTRTPEETEEALMRVIPMDLWIPVNPLLVQHGQNLCRPIGPKCGECPIRAICETGSRWRPPGQRRSSKEPS
jgi:endonuclease III